MGRAFAAAHLPALMTSTGDTLLLPCGIAAPSSLSSVCPPPSPSLRHFFQPAPGPRTARRGRRHHQPPLPKFPLPPPWVRAPTRDRGPGSHLPRGSAGVASKGLRSRSLWVALPPWEDSEAGRRLRHRKAGVGRRSQAKGRGPGAGWAGRAGVRGRGRGARRELLFFLVFLKLLRLTPGAFPLTEGGVPGASETHRSAPPWYFLKSLFLEERQQVGTPSRRHPFSVLGVSHRWTPPICPISPPPRYPP